MKNAKKLVTLGLLSAILIVLSYTPLGYLNLGPLAITFNPIAVAIAACAYGMTGGMIIGGVFGLTSFLQCFGGSALGTALFAVNPALTAVQCFVPRILDGLVIGFLSETMKKKAVPPSVNFSVTGFLSAFLNTVFYMGSLVMLFGQSEVIMNYRTSLAPGKNVFLFICAFVGINAVSEWISTTAITGPVAYALAKAGLIAYPMPHRKSAEAGC